jgi:hypothetical protein
VDTEKNTFWNEILILFDLNTNKGIFESVGGDENPKEQCVRGGEKEVRMGDLSLPSPSSSSSSSSQRE